MLLKFVLTSAWHIPL